MTPWPTWKAAALDALGALAVLALDLPYALLDEAVSPLHRGARLVVAVLVALSVLLARRRLPLLVLGLAVVDVLVKYVGAFSLGWAAYAVARHQRNGYVGAIALVVASFVSIKVWTWSSREEASAHLAEIVYLVAIPAGAGAITRFVARANRADAAPARAEAAPPPFPPLPSGPPPADDWARRARRGRRDKEHPPDLVAGLDQLDSVRDRDRPR